MGWKALVDEAEQLSDENGGTWGEHPDHPVSEWQHEVEDDYTRLGYWLWVAARIESEDE